MNNIFDKRIKEKSDMAIIMCTYRRFRNLELTYKNLSAQTNKEFDFYICDNSHDTSLVLKVTKKYYNIINYNLSIEHYKNKYSIFGRFYLARELAKSGYKYIVFIDDDQLIPMSFVQDCYDQYEEKVVKSFYAHMISGDYWKKEMLDNKEEGNYVGGGGLLCDAKIFLDDKLFDCPEEYWILDDLWFSYYLADFTDYKMKRLNTPISFIKDTLATARLLKKEKREFSDKYIMKRVSK